MCVQQGDNSVPATPCNVLEMMRQHLEENDSKRISSGSNYQNIQKICILKKTKKYVHKNCLQQVHQLWKTCLCPPVRKHVMCRRTVEQPQQRAPTLRSALGQTVESPSPR